MRCCCAPTMRRAFNAVVARLTVEGEDINDLHQKMTYVMFCTAALVAATASLGNDLLHPLFKNLLYIIMGTSLVGLGAVLYTKRLPTGLLVGTIVMYMGATSGMDIYTIPVGVRCWPLFVLVIDFFLVMGVPRWWVLMVVGYVLTFVFAMELELVYRVGVLDLPGSIPNEVRRELSCCEAPPCGRGELVSLPTYLSPVYCVFVTDFLLTRWFQETASREQRRTAAAVEAAEVIAGSLADFDLNAASAYLEGSREQLPAELLASLQALLQNLASYQPYLPQSLLPKSAHGRGNSDSTDGSDAGSRGSRSSVHTVSSRSSFALPLPGLARLPSEGRIPTPRAETPRAEMRNPVLGSNHLTSRAVVILGATLSPGSVAEEGILGFAKRHEKYLETVIAAVGRARGVVDTFLGYNVTASFHAARAVTNAPGKAARAAHAIADGLANEHPGKPHTIAVAQGQAHVGVLGTSSMRRPCVLGPLVSSVRQMQRYAALRDLRAVCNHKQYRDTYFAEEMRIAFDRVYLDVEEGDVSKPEPIYEMLLKGKADSVPNDPREWMYEMDEAAGSWQTYNEAGLHLIISGREAADSYLRDNDADAALWTKFTRSAEGMQRVEFKPVVACDSDVGDGASAIATDASDDPVATPPARAISGVRARVRSASVAAPLCDGAPRHTLTTHAA